MNVHEEVALAFHLTSKKLFSFLFLFGLTAPEKWHRWSTTCRKSCLSYCWATRGKRKKTTLAKQIILPAPPPLPHNTSNVADVIWCELRNLALSWKLSKEDAECTLWKVTHSRALHALYAIRWLENKKVISLWPQRQNGSGEPSTVQLESHYFIR